MQVEDFWHRTGLFSWEGGFPRETKNNNIEKNKQSSLGEQKLGQKSDLKNEIKYDV